MDKFYEVIETNWIGEDGDTYTDGLNFFRECGMKYGIIFNIPGVEEKLVRKYLMFAVEMMLQRDPSVLLSIEYRSFNIPYDDRDNIIKVYTDDNGVEYWDEVRE